MYMEGVTIKHRAHAGLNHQKSVILYDQNGPAAGDQSLVIFGSSNWTSPSAAGLVEHNIFTSKRDRVSCFSLNSCPSGFDQRVTSPPASPRRVP